jgi:hypothetical protein
MIKKLRSAKDLGLREGAERGGGMSHRTPLLRESPDPVRTRTNGTNTGIQPVCRIPGFTPHTYRGEVQMDRKGLWVEHGPNLSIDPLLGIRTRPWLSRDL